MAEFTNMYLQRLGHKHFNFVWVGGYIGSWMQFGTPDWVKGYVPIAIAGLERDAERRPARAVRRRCPDGLRQRLPRGGATGLEQFVSYDPADLESTKAGIRHMEDAVKDAAVHGFPPGKEFIYLQIGWTDEEIWDALATQGSRRSSSTSSARSRRRSTPTTLATACIRPCRRPGSQVRTAVAHDHDG